MNDQRPAPIGTDEEQTEHHHVPTVAEHNAHMHAERPDDCISDR